MQISAASGRKMMEKRRGKGAMDLREVGKDAGSTAIGSHAVRRGA